MPNNIKLSWKKLVFGRLHKKRLIWVHCGSFDKCMYEKDLFVFFRK